MLTSSRKRRFDLDQAAIGGAAADATGDTDHWRVLGPAAAVTDLIVG